MPFFFARICTFSGGIGIVEQILLRKHDKVYNGKLRIVFGNGKYLKDSDSVKLEDRLGEILVCLYEDSERERIARGEREYTEAGGGNYYFRNNGNGNA